MTIYYYYYTSNFGKGYRQFSELTICTTNAANHFWRESKNHTVLRLAVSKVTCGKV